MSVLYVVYMHVRVVCTISVEVGLCVVSDLNSLSSSKRFFTDSFTKLRMIVAIRGLTRRAEERWLSESSTQTLNFLRLSLILILFHFLFTLHPPPAHLCASLSSRQSGIGIST